MTRTPGFFGKEAVTAVLEESWERIARQPAVPHAKDFMLKRRAKKAARGKF